AVGRIRFGVLPIQSDQERFFRKGTRRGDGDAVARVMHRGRQTTSRIDSRCRSRFGSRSRDRWTNCVLDLESEVSAEPRMLRPETPFSPKPEATRKTPRRPKDYLRPK